MRIRSLSNRLAEAGDVRYSEPSRNGANTMHRTALLLCIGAAAGAQPPLEAVKQQCRAYIDGFLSPATDLCYGKRLDTPKGLAILESPESIAREQVGTERRPWGYGAGVEDVALQNGYLLYALCDAHEKTRDPYLAELARRIFRGMRRIATCSPVPGFVPRGPHPDGRSYYRDSSTDQHTLFVCALWRYAGSPLASAEDRSFVAEILGNVAARLERNGWVLKVEDDSRVAHVGWNWSAKTEGSAGLFLSTLGAVAEATDSPHWRAVYRQFADEEGGVRWQCLARDPGPSPRYTLFYNQHAFRQATLARLERDPDRAAVAWTRLVRTAGHMLSCDALAEWRPLDWIGAVPEENVREYLRTLGIGPGQTRTVGQLWERYRQGERSPAMSWNRRRLSYAGLCHRAPVISWQYALLSRDPGLRDQVLPRLPEILARIDLGRESSGWVANETIVFLLLALAAG